MKKTLILSLCAMMLSAVATAQPSPTKIGQLDDQLIGSSSLFFWQSDMISANDHGTLSFYVVNPDDASISSTVANFNPVVTDMEEVAQDDEYLYLADVGNNDGTRTDLHILRYSKSGIMSGEAQTPDTIWFAYADQTGFAGPTYGHDFDCEAIVAGEQNIYVITKSWQTYVTKIYSCPKTPGRYSIEAVASYDLSAHKGLITGAAYDPTLHTLALIGYKPHTLPAMELPLKAFILLFKDFEGEDFFSGNAEFIDLNIIRQTEAIATNNGVDYYFTCEQTTQRSITLRSELYHIDLRSVIFDSIQLDVEVVNAKCKGDNNGSFTVTAAGGDGGPYTYRLGDEPSSSNTFGQLHAGVYHITVSDEHGNKTEQDVTISEPEELTLEATLTTPASAEGVSDAVVTLTAEGGTPDYQYMKDIDGELQDNNVFSGLSAEQYVFAVVDANGCSVSTNIEVTIDLREGIDDIATSQLTVYPNPAADHICVSGITATVEAAIIDFAGRRVATHTLTPEANTISVASLPAGTYSILIGKTVKTFVRQ